jgi:hypothetical protein
MFFFQLCPPFMQGAFAVTHDHFARINTGGDKQAGGTDIGRSGAEHDDFDFAHFFADNL